MQFVLGLNFSVKLYKYTFIFQFIAGRLDMINDGVGYVDIFEKAVIRRNKGMYTLIVKINMLCPE